MGALYNELAHLHHLLARITPPQPWIDALAQHSQMQKIMVLDGHVEEHNLLGVKVMAKLSVQLNKGLTTFVPLSSHRLSQIVVVLIVIHDALDAHSEGEQRFGLIVLSISRVHQLAKSSQQRLCQVPCLCSFAFQPWELLLRGGVHGQLEFLQLAAGFEFLNLQTMWSLYF